jgi:hypothetical protein
MSADDDKDGKPDKPLSDKITERIKEEVTRGVGYGRPPKHTQFKKGQSGNPRGRPRGVAPDLTLSQQPFLAAVLRASQEKVRVREGGQPVEMTLREAIIKATSASALKGDPRAQGLMHKVIRTAEETMAKDIASRNAIWSAYKESRSELIADAASRNEPLPDFLPHPEDIEIDWQEGPRFLGPVEETGLAQVTETIAYCEVLLMQDALHQRSSHRHNDEPLTEPGSAMLLFWFLQRAVPPRLRLSDTQIIMKQDRFLATPKRQLLKDLRRAWKRLGKPMPRGMVMPNVTVMRKYLEYVFDFYAEATAGHLDLAAISQGNFDDRALAFMERHGVRI